MNWVDLIFLGVLTLSVLVGLWRGIVFELLSLAGWPLAYFGAKYLAPWVGQCLPQAKLGPSLLAALSLVLAFVAVLLLWSLSAKLLQTLIHASPLSLIDRLAGGGFGAVRGLLVTLLVVVAVSLTPWAQSESWERSQLAPLLHSLLQGLKPLLPEAVLRYLPA